MPLQLPQGATKANCLIADSRTGATLHRLENIPLVTNQYLVSLPKAVDNIVSVIQQTMKSTDLKDIYFDCIALSLSGICNDDDSKKMAAELGSRKYPQCRVYLVCDDMKACKYCSPNPGGIVIISGTGQNSMFYAPDRSNFTHKAGGWGHLL